MLFMRWIAMLLLLAAALCLGMYLSTGQARWRNWMIAIVRWTVVAGLGMFGVLLLERLVILI